MRWLGRFVLWLGRWEAVGGIPDDPEAVIIAAPHTSNWDAVWAIAYKLAVGLDVKWFAKHSAFWFPLGNILRAFGAIDLDRDNAGTAVDEAIRLFNEKDSFYFALAPEGTRTQKPGWKTGFYRIATGANVPVCLGFIDFGRRRIGIGPAIHLSGEPEADLAVIRKFYKGIEGRWPEKASPIEFPDYS